MVIGVVILFLHHYIGTLLLHHHLFLISQLRLSPSSSPHGLFSLLWRPKERPHSLPTSSTPPLSGSLVRHDRLWFLLIVYSISEL
jgi:hypothetical protein